MKVLFCIYQLDFADHIAIPYLSAVAKKLGHETFLCILKERNLSDVVKEIRPDVVAYSANIAGFEEMVVSHKAARKIYDFISIMGGPHPTFFPETFASTGVDAYCIGEGELAFEDFLRRVEQKKSYDDLPNLITASANNPVRPLIKNLDDLPFPDRDITLGNSFLKNTPKKTFYTMRGCPFQCNYCCNNYFRALYTGKGPAIRRFSVERVLTEIEYVKKRYRTDFIKFGDDLFAMVADDWLEEFAEKYPKRIGVPFNCYLRFDRVDEKLLVLLKKAGCFSAHLSVDSTSEFVREEILGRRMKKVDIIENLRLIKSYGINTWVNFMLAAPESTLEDDMRSIEMSKSGAVTYTAYSTTVPMAGTALYDYCCERDLIDFNQHKNDMTGCYSPSALKCFSTRERKIRFNIFLLGALIAKLPNPLDKLAVQLIKIIPPNPLFQKLRSIYYKYSIENTIFRLHKEPG